ncbi:MAG: MliC family protein [Fusobacterium sp.]|uniref:MliC family protein n=1 Tax=Fusobacterium sp. TaxID=68766 RepID=UPI0026DA8237|nr:MliC family protein [Fusobacterium sp.]MDO4690318.1 MliC family protein [Fusobacterium sp.]
MKKITLMAILLSLALVACGEKKVEEVKEAATQTVEQVKETATEAVAEAKESAEKAVESAKNAASEVIADAKAAMSDALKFKAADGTEYSLDITGDNAVLKTSTGKEYPLKAAVTGSGVRFADEKGNEIHFKGDEGVVNLDGKETTIKALSEDNAAMMSDALKFKAADGTEYNLDIAGDNAILKTSTGEEFPLKAAVAGSGVRFADEKGNEIHFKGNEGTVKLNGKETNIEAVK